MRAGLNLVWTGLLATVYYAVKTLVGPEIPANAGLFRPDSRLGPERDDAQLHGAGRGQLAAPRRASAWWT